MLRRVPHAVCAAAVAVTAVACTASESDGKAKQTFDNSPPITVTLPATLPPPSPPPPSSPSPLEPTPAPGTPQGEALEAYKQLLAAMAQASLTSNPDFPLLAEYAMGEALASVRYTLTVNRDNGLTAKGPLRLAPQVESVSPDRALVRIKDCLDDSQWLRYRQDGSLKDSIPGGRRSTTAEVVSVDGAWKVSVLRVSATGTC